MCVRACMNNSFLCVRACMNNSIPCVRACMNNSILCVCMRARVTPLYFALVSNTDFVEKGKKRALFHSLFYNIPY